MFNEHKQTFVIITFKKARLYVWMAQNYVITISLWIYRKRQKKKHIFRIFATTQTIISFSKFNLLRDSS